VCLLAITAMNKLLIAGDHLGEWYKQKTTDKPYAPSKPFNTIF
jgi:hypothetical protein